MSHSTRKTVITLDDLYDRFHSRVLPQVGGCWLWKGFASRQGYGRINVPRALIESSPIKFKQTEYAHRVSFVMRHGRLPWPGRHIDHLCRNRACVNPAHLEEVSPRENYRRGDSPAWIAHRERVCQRGHALPARGQCRVCANASAKRKRGEPTRCPAATKAALWERCAGRCDFCGNAVTRHNVHVHHRKLRSQGGTWDLGNLLAVHRTCHTGTSYSIHANPERSYALGHLVRSRDDPAAVPVQTWAGGTTLRTGEVHRSRIEGVG